MSVNYILYQLTLKENFLHCAIIDTKQFLEYKKYFLRNSMDRGFWFGGKDERGMMFFDDYFWGRDPWEFFGDFLENFKDKFN